MYSKTANPFYFPYCNYPYTWKQKIKYYSGKFACANMCFAGVSLYARFLWKQPYLTTKQIANKNMEELNNLIELTGTKKIWHLKSLCLNILVLLSIKFIFWNDKSPYFCQTYSPVKNYIKYALGTICFVTTNNIYGVLAHTYNTIRFNRQIDIINHGMDIMNAIKTIDTDLSIREKNIDTIIYGKIGQNKMTWISFDLLIKENKIVYVIYNAYYEQIIFVFNSQKMANDFFVEISKLCIDQIDNLSDDPEKIIKIQNEFIKSRLYSNLIQFYLSK